MAFACGGLGAVVLLSSLVSATGLGSSSSCQGHCGSWTDDCWCNDACESHGNCCADWAAVCGGAASCARCGTYTCDDWIRWDPQKYSCASLKQDWGCDCSGCSSCSAALGSADLVLLNDAKHPQARCLDGSMAGYYWRQGAAEGRYLLFFEGGGWCYDANCDSPTAEGTLADCRKRSEGRLGSSNSWSATKDGSWFTGMLSSDLLQNPIFNNWTLIYLPYCDGTSWSGDAVVDGLHFRGRAILDAVMTELGDVRGITSASQVVLSGGSAGASAVLWHGDALAGRLRRVAPAAEVVALPDAGFFLDLPDRWGTSSWPRQMRSIFNVSNGYGSLHAGCLGKFPEEPWRCLFPQYYADMISTRTLVLHSLYDLSELQSTLRLDCCPGGCSGYPTCKPGGEEMALFEGLRAQHLAAWAPLLHRRGNGVWAPACVDHTMSWNHWTDPAWEVPAGSGHTLAAVVQEWLDFGRAPVFSADKHFVFQDNVSWPENKGCAHSKLAPFVSESADLDI